MLELKHVSFEVGDGAVPRNHRRHQPDARDGRFFIITGPNGGKSTLARLIMGIEEADGGPNRLQRRDITNLGVTERAKLGIGYAFQHPPASEGMTVHRAR